jgi:hypothetical protein
MPAKRKVRTNPAKQQNQTPCYLTHIIRIMYWIKTKLRKFIGFAQTTDPI